MIEDEMNSAAVYCKCQVPTLLIRHKVIPTCYWRAALVFLPQHCSRLFYLNSPQRAWLKHKSSTTKRLTGWRSSHPTETMRITNRKKKKKTSHRQLERHHTQRQCEKMPAPRQKGRKNVKGLGKMLCFLTPAQTQKALADESGPNLSCHCHVGLPGLCEDPAEGCEEEEV